MHKTCVLRGYIFLDMCHIFANVFANSRQTHNLPVHMYQKDKKAFSMANLVDRSGP